MRVTSYQNRRTVNVWWKSWVRFVYLFLLSVTTGRDRQTSGIHAHPPAYVSHRSGWDGFAASEESTAMRWAEKTTGRSSLSVTCSSYRKWGRFEKADGDKVGGWTENTTQDVLVVEETKSIDPFGVSVACGGDLLKELDPRAGPGSSGKAYAIL